MPTRSRETPAWRLPTALIVLSLVPVVAGVSRLTKVATAELGEGNARFAASPVPIVLHIVGAVAFCVLGAFQFPQRIRRTHPRWHRLAGRALIPCGLIAALTGVWMTLYYPHPVGDGPLLLGFRLVFGTAMAVALTLGYLTVRRRDFRAHRAWMIRGYAIGQGAGTQVLTGLPWAIAFGQPDELTRALLLGASWVVNIAVAEWVIRRSPRPAARPVLG
ncbi:DUF2306 domain-containing protein [Actinokineospora sp. NBRC 105648]|uniref:DUF2306 domain-containing protein n=1 Tax=Actinokineospora sp. NBRC 105648 TaxID=3032206 RepID=UPI0024A57605|nr:DUF2306 domain-containing protein [Actinokineospora sp. NBRC 105648]GLZ43060.1 membrane protein [Actinokineospora sp. NBRC 105648]